MKTLFCLLFTAMGALAQTTTWDSSLIKNGNTWTYRYQSSSTTQGRLMSTDSLLSVFTVDSVRFSGDTLHFVVLRNDTGSYYRYYPPFTGHDRNLSTARYTFSKGVAGPSEPLFMTGQSFSANDRKVVYKGATLRMTTHNVGLDCWSQKWKNLEKVGRIEFEDIEYCGTSGGFTRYSLLAFNGEAFDPNAIVVALRSGPRALVSGAGRIVPRFREGRVELERTGRLFDLNGQQVQGPRANP